MQYYKNWKHSNKLMIQNFHIYTKNKCCSLLFPSFKHINRKMNTTIYWFSFSHWKHRSTAHLNTHLKILRKTHLCVSLERLLCFSGQRVLPVCEVCFWGRCCCTAAPITPSVGWPSHQTVHLTQYTQTHHTHTQQKPAQNAHTAKGTHGKARGVTTSDCTQLSDDPCFLSPIFRTNCCLLYSST